MEAGEDGKTCAQILTFMLMGGVNKRDRRAARGEEEGDDEELGGRGQREIGGERIRL